MIGHLNPLLSIGRILVAGGHEVVGHTASAHRHRFQAAGASFQPFDDVIDQDLSDLDQVYPELKSLASGPEKLMFLFKRVFIGRLVAQDASLKALLGRFPADLVLTDNLFLGTFPLLLGPRDQRPAIAHFGVTPLFTTRDDGAPHGPGLPPATDDATIADYRMMRDMIDPVFFAPMQQEIDRVLASIGIGPLATPLNDASVILPDLFFQPTVDAFEYPRRSPPASLHFIGALPLPAIETPLPDWAGDVSRATTVVLVTQGTLANHDLGEVVAPTLAALKDRPDILVVVATGGRSIETIPGEIPDNARVAEFLPYDWLMPQVDLVVTNGGYGTVNFALSQGVPLVVAGTNEDKAEVGARVSWSGVGIGLQTDTPRPVALRKAIERVLGEDRYREAAELMAQRFLDADSENRVLRLFEAAVANHVSLHPNPRPIVLEMS